MVLFTVSKPTHYLFVMDKVGFSDTVKIKEVNL